MGRGKRNAVPDMVGHADSTAPGVERSEGLGEASGKKEGETYDPLDPELQELFAFIGAKATKQPPPPHRVLDVGFDISTAVVGICALDQATGKLVDMRSIKFSPVKQPTMWSKADEFKRLVGEFQAEMKTKGSGWKIGRVFVEANAKMFTPGFSSADTIITLAKFNGICSYITQDMFKVPIVDVNVVSARSKLGIKIDRKDKSKGTKEKVRESVVALYPDIPIKTHIAKTGKMKGQLVPDKEMEDVLDAFVIVSGGRILNPIC